MPIFMSEIRFENASDFIEVVAPTGTDMTGYTVGIYDSTGKYVGSFGLGSPVVTTLGNDGYVVDMGAGIPDMGQNWGVALIDNGGTVLQFVSGEGSVMTASDGPAVGETSIAGPVTSGGQSIVTNDQGGTYVVEASPNPGTIPCFARGTLISTPQGERPIEDLQIGDLVYTLDHGAQPIFFKSARRVDLEDAPTERKPILISAHAFAPGCPTKDLVLSAQHRVLVGGFDQIPDAYGEETLVPAKALTLFPNIREMKGARSIEWFHIGFQQHQIIRAAGCYVESLLLGEMVLNSLTRLQKGAYAETLGATQIADPSRLVQKSARQCSPCSEAEFALGKVRWNPARKSLVN
ncbi:Hint domain-containing protein [Maritimibacter alexandrii]|uniref:Hint domain-containing protein n=1 Tax=Maritimibacter alexandrii TaxID=2570355 RepID=UPI001109A6FA|nr:Hint domain-containing protein [Maritimibacter alexandrii]